MFTGIIEETGKLLSVEKGAASAVLTIGASLVTEGTRVGDSIAVNGVCLTVTKLGPDRFSADVMAETLRRSSLGQLSAGAAVNLERALAVGGRLGGHIVSGHIDGTGRITEISHTPAPGYSGGSGKRIMRYGTGSKRMQSCFAISWKRDPLRWTVSV